MKRNWLGWLLVVALCAAPFFAAAQDAMDEMHMMGPMAPSSMKAVLWTDQLGYATGEQMNVYLSIDAMGDRHDYTCFVYRENIETGERQYLPLTPGGSLTDEVVDSAGMVQGDFHATSVNNMDKARIWSGSVPEPGLWQWVGELRNADATQVPKKMHAKFVVS